MQTYVFRNGVVRAVEGVVRITTYEMDCFDPNAVVLIYPDSPHEQTSKVRTKETERESISKDEISLPDVY